jgi:hypothetical protein
MTILVPNSSEVRMLSNILNIIAPQDLDLQLYSNSWAPIDATGAGDLTEVAGGYGYAEAAMVVTSWSVTAGAPSVAAYPAIQWIFTASFGLVHGAMIKERTSGILKWAEQFPSGPYNMTNSGDSITYTAKIQLKKQGE